MADPLAALGALASHWRARFDIPLAIVVGSNGKTTVKEMTASILRAHYGVEEVLATEGNLNNAIGLPLTLLRLSDRARAAVIELGMNHRGETRELAAIAQPTIAVVNNAQREHQEFMEQRRRSGRRARRRGACVAAGRGRRAECRRRASCNMARRRQAGRRAGVDVRARGFRERESESRPALRPQRARDRDAAGRAAT